MEILTITEETDLNCLDGYDATKCHLVVKDCTVLVGDGVLLTVETHGEGDQFHYGNGDQISYGDGVQLHFGVGDQIHYGTGDQTHYGDGVTKRISRLSNGRKLC